VGTCGVVECFLVVLTCCCVVSIFFSCSSPFLLFGEYPSLWSSPAVVWWAPFFNALHLFCCLMSTPLYGPHLLLCGEHLFLMLFTFSVVWWVPLFYGPHLLLCGEHLIFNTPHLFCCLLSTPLYGCCVVSIYLNALHLLCYSVSTLILWSLRTWCWVVSTFLMFGEYSFWLSSIVWWILFLMVFTFVSLASTLSGGLLFPDEYSF
jgi:hypothetical protein